MKAIFKFQQLSSYLLLTIRTLDPILLTSLILAFTFCLYGIHWGWVEEWNVDQMAFRNLFQDDGLPFEPGNFLKPPFHTYFNYVLSVLPISIGEWIFKDLLNLSVDFSTAKLIWSRLLTAFLFLGAIALVFHITRLFFGRFSARIIAILIATSAGFIVDSHYLTADIPVLFWMVLAFAFIQQIALRGYLSDYLWAGFFTGIATATKYNGLGIGIGIVVAHILRSKPITWETPFEQKLWRGLGMVAIGFIAGNPFSILFFQKFISDFRYNYLVTPIYRGNPATDRSYWTFFTLCIEIIGLPAFLIGAIAILLSIYWLLTAQQKQKLSQEEKNSTVGMWLLLSVFLLYYYKFGGFPRLEARFIMPIIPFLLMISGPFWKRIASQKRVVVILMIPLITYNSLSSVYVGKRFTEDSRMYAITWVKHHVPQGAVVESTPYTPKWDLLPNLHVSNTRMPSLSNRRQQFEALFQNDPTMLEQIQQYESTEQEEKQGIRWYATRRLLRRNPDYIALSSLYYRRFFRGMGETFYPSVKQFFEAVLNQQTPYKIVFDQPPISAPRWLYPHEIRFVDTRTVILQNSSREDLPRRVVNSKGDTG